MSMRPAWWIGIHRRIRPGSRAAGYWLAAVLTALAFTPPLAAIGTTVGDLPRRELDLLAVLLTLGMTVPLAVRTRWPAGCVAVIGISFAVHESLGYPPTFGAVALLLALYTAGAYQHRFRLALAGTAAAGYLAFCLVLHLLGSPDRAADFVVFFLALAATVAIGALVRRRRGEEAERRRLEAEAATAAERARIARELHDVMTHHVTAMVVQANAAGFLIASPGGVTEALSTISETGREALGELRSLLSVLEATGESAKARQIPALGSVPALVRRTKLGGQPVELVEEGEPPTLSADAELAGYRVVQEALTNAVKYAAGRRTLVHIGYAREVVTIDVTTEGHDPVAAGHSVAPAELRGGRGLNGLRERVRHVGGELAVDGEPDGRFRVQATIPAGRGR
jgi:signal transduction histidine kinase